MNIDQQRINRRNWLRTSMLALGGTAVATALPWGTYGETVTPFWTNKPRLMTRPFPFMDYELKAKLNANENKFGPSAMAQKAAAEAISAGNYYAHKEVMKLKGMLAEKEGVKPEQIILGPGSTDLLEKTAVISFMGAKKGNIVSADPAYMSIIRSAQRVGAEWKNIPCKKDWAHDLNAMADAVDEHTKLVYVCNPNNPTGAITPAKELWDFCSKVSEKAPVFVDEAYLEFLPVEQQKSMVGLVKEGKDIILSRTFSKIHGMAGLRVGYVVAKEERIEAINKVLRSSYNLSISSLMAAMASLNDTAQLKFCREKNDEAKAYVYKMFKSMDIDYVPSATSFIFFPLKIDGEQYMKGMYEKGVGVRLFEMDGKPWGRVSMGTMSEMKMFVDTLKKVIS